MLSEFYTFAENNDILEAIFQPNINLFCILEKNGSFLKVNQGFTHILGIHQEDLGQSSFFDFIHPEDREVTEYALKQLVVAEELLHFVNRFQDAYGRYVTISWCIHWSSPFLFVAGNEKFKSISSEPTQKAAAEGNDSAHLKKGIYKSLKLISLLEATKLTDSQGQLLKSLKDNIEALEGSLRASPTFPASPIKKASGKFNQNFTNSIISNQCYPENKDSTTSRKPRILIIDDSILNRKLLESALSKSYEIRSASCGEEALMMIESSSLPDLILLDIILPKMNGFEICQKLQRNPNTKDIPVIFLTSLSENEDVEYGLKLGAIDYITKPFSMPIVKAKIKNYLSLKYYQDILKKHTDLDQLTKISNRRRFDEVFSIETGKARRYRRYLSLLLIDIDYFKQYNDTYGHLEGDCCLKEIALTLTETLKRPGDFVARWGGEEFVCLLPDTDSAGASQVAQKLKEAVCLKRIPHESSPVHDVVTVSIGVVTSDPQDSDSLGNLMKLADVALYEAKNTGRNRICVKKSLRRKTTSLKNKGYL